MYGSKSDHSKSRNPKGFYRREPGVLMSDREAIKEGVLAHLDMDERASQVTRADFMDEGDVAFEMYAGEEPLAEWEWELLREGDRETYADYVDDFTAMQDEVADHEDFGAYYGDPAEYEPEQDLDSEEHPSAWLTVPPVEFFDAVGDAFVIEGPTCNSPEPTRTNYTRVHELAKRAGITSKVLIEYLRMDGEYVRCAQSYVAQPVVDRILASKRWEPAEVSRSYASEEAIRSPIRSLRERLAQPETLRPGAPRPGNNPFLSR